MCTMLRLKNIEKNEEKGTIRADYYPEGSEERGFVVVDLKTEEILDCKITSYDELMGTYRAHAKQALLRIANEEEVIPSEQLVMWY